MDRMPYRDGCPKCDAVRAYWRSVNDYVERLAEESEGDVMVGLTIDAEKVPMCEEHL